MTTPKPKRTRWTADKLTQLKELAAKGLGGAEIAHVIGATPSAIEGACARYRVSRNSQRSQEIREAIRRGVRLIREDVGGAIGVRWSSAHRGGETYPTAYCEALVEMGLLELDGSIYVGSGLYKPS